MWNVARIIKTLQWIPVQIALLSGIGCGSNFLHSDTTHTVLSLTERELQEGGLALITPSTVTGRDEDKQALALAFFSIISEQRPDVQVFSLAQTLSAINRADLVEQYERMFIEEAAETGIFRRDILSKITQVTGSRYLAQLKLAGFRQETLVRWSLLGVRLVQTRRATMRLFLQIWDSQDGSIAWEGSVEVVQSIETSSEHEVTLRSIARQAAMELVRGLPGGVAATEPPSSAFDELDGEPSR
jgi:hypothetical protein